MFGASGSIGCAPQKLEARFRVIILLRGRRKEASLILRCMKPLELNLSLTVDSFRRSIKNLGRAFEADRLIGYASQAV